MDILNSYVLTEPSSQNVLDLFKGEWSSRLPGHLGLATQPATAALFEDGRIEWAERVFGGFAGRKILELGPLEGGHSYMLHRGNAARVVSIEANARAFLKCLCIKEIFKLDRVEYKLGDFVAFLDKADSRYDLVIGSGVLYHMEEPVRLLKLIAGVTDRLFLWTHYYDERIITGREDLSHRFGPVGSLEFDGADYEYATQAYKESLAWAGFCGGPRPVSKWLTRASILKALGRYGFADLRINFDDVGHANGPAFAICASRPMAGGDGGTQPAR